MSNKTVEYEWILYYSAGDWDVRGKRLTCGSVIFRIHHGAIDQHLVEHSGIGRAAVLVGGTSKSVGGHLEWVGYRRHAWCLYCCLVFSACEQNSRLSML